MSTPYISSIFALFRKAVSVAAGVIPLDNKNAIDLTNTLTLNLQLAYLIIQYNCDKKLLLTAIFYTARGHLFQIAHFDFQQIEIQK